MSECPTSTHGDSWWCPAVGFSWVSQPWGCTSAWSLSVIVIRARPRVPTCHGNFPEKIPPGAPEGWHVSGVEIFQGPRLFVTFFDFDTVDGNQKSGEKSPVEGTVLYPSIYYVFTGCFLYPSPRRWSPDFFHLQYPRMMPEKIRHLSTKSIHFADFCRP